VQAIDARLTGIIKTSPIREIIGHVEAEGGVVLDKNDARINRVDAVKHAFDLGFKRIAVTVAGFQAKAISEIREFEAVVETDALIFSICNTCAVDADVKDIAKADIVCASASKTLRNEIGGKALLQLGVTIPVYALTERGKRLVLAYLVEFNEKLVVFRTGKLPYLTEVRGPKLKGDWENRGCRLILFRMGLGCFFG